MSVVKKLFQCTSKNANSIYLDHFKFLQNLIKITTENRFNKSLISMKYIGKKKKIYILLARECTFHSIEINNSKVELQQCNGKIQVIR